LAAAPPAQALTHDRSFTGDPRFSNVVGTVSGTVTLTLVQPFDVCQATALELTAPPVACPALHRMAAG
jgi:hypothetical protein